MERRPNLLTEYTRRIENHYADDRLVGWKNRVLKDQLKGRKPRDHTARLKPSRQEIPPADRGVRIPIGYHPAP